MKEDILLYPPTRNEALQELKPKKNHKWVFASLGDCWTNELKEHMRRWFNSGRELDVEEFINVARNDDCIVNFKDLTITTDTKEIKVTFVYCGLSDEEVEGYWLLFQNHMEFLERTFKERMEEEARVKHFMSLSPKEKVDYMAQRKKEEEVIQ